MGLSLPKVSFLVTSLDSGVSGSGEQAQVEGEGCEGVFLGRS